MTGIELRAMGALAGKMAEITLQMAQATDAGDHAEGMRLAGSLLKIVFAIQECTAEFGTGAPWHGLEDAWRTMGAEAGWLPVPTESVP